MYVCVYQGFPVVGLLSLNNAFCHFLYAKVIQNSNQVRSQLHANLHIHTHTCTCSTLLLLLLPLLLPPSSTVAYFESLSDIVCKFLARHKLKLNELTSFSSLNWSPIPTPTPYQTHTYKRLHTHTHARAHIPRATHRQVDICTDVAHAIYGNSKSQLELSRNEQWSSSAQPINKFKIISNEKLKALNASYIFYIDKFKIRLRLRSR